MTREEIEQALFTLSGHDPKFREVGLTADLWKHIERLEKALRLACEEIDDHSGQLPHATPEEFIRAALAPEDKEGE